MRGRRTADMVAFASLFILLASSSWRSTSAFYVTRENSLTQPSRTLLQSTTLEQQIVTSPEWMRNPTRKPLSSPSIEHRPVASTEPKRIMVSTVHNKTKQQPPTNGRSLKENRYRWLTWLYQHWKDVPVGKLDESITKQIIPALNLYAKLQTPQAARQSEQLLYRYVAEYKAGNPAVTYLNNTAFHATMDAYAKNGETDRVQRILSYMKDLSDAGDHPLLQPDAFSFTILAAAWAKSRHPTAAKNSQRILEHMENKGMEVTTITYNVVLSAIALSHDKNKDMRARAIVQRMKQLASQGHTRCQPDLYTYQSWMAACSRVEGGLGQTLKILRYLEKQSDAGEHALQPNAHCFSAAMHAWAHSCEPGKERQAYLLLQEMRRRYELLGQKDCKPNVVVFTACMNACVKPTCVKEQSSCYEIARLVLKELKYSSYGMPNFLTYAAFLSVCADTLDDQGMREEEIRRVFGECCRNGEVGKIVIQKFKDGASNELCEDILGGIDKVWDDLPIEWRRRVKGERYIER